MYIVLMDATGVDGQRHVGDHGVAALARMARREGHRVSHLVLPALAQELPQPWLSLWASCDVVHVVAAAQRLPLLAGLMRLARATVLTIVDLPPAVDGRHLPAPMPALPNVSCCVVRSRHAALQWQPATTSAAICVLPRGVDLLALMQAAQPGAPCRADPAGTVLHPTLVCPGPFDERSGIDTLLRAFASVEGADLRLRLLGTFDDGTSQGRTCSDLAATDARVCIDADMTDGSLAAIAREVDLVCVPDLDAQAFALAVHEGAALGVACLVTEHGAQAEAVADFACGLCLAPGDVQAWAQAISHWADHFTGRRAAASDMRLPMRLEEEAFFYEGLYRQAMLEQQRDCALGA